MKKKLIIFCLLLCFVGCTNNKSIKIINSLDNTINGYWQKTFQEEYENDKLINSDIYFKSSFLHIDNNSITTYYKYNNNYYYNTKNISTDKDKILFDDEEPILYYLHYNLLSKNMTLQYDLDEKIIISEYEKITKERFDYMTNGGIGNDTEK